MGGIQARVSDIGGANGTGLGNNFVSLSRVESSPVPVRVCVCDPCCWCAEDVRVKCVRVVRGESEACLVQA